MSHSSALPPVKDATCHLPRLASVRFTSRYAKVFKNKHVNCGNLQGGNVTLPFSK